MLSDIYSCVKFDHANTFLLCHSFCLTYLMTNVRKGVDIKPSSLTLGWFVNDESGVLPGHLLHSIGDNDLQLRTPLVLPFYPTTRATSKSRQSQGNYFIAPHIYPPPNPL